jgi:hypothetical protein
VAKLMYMYVMFPDFGWQECDSILMVVLNGLILKRTIAQS